MILEEEKKTPSTAPAKQTPAAAPAAAGPPHPPKVETPSPTPLEMIAPQLRAFLEQKLRSGETVTIEVGKDSFTGRIFRVMLQEGWIASEHEDGRRRMFFLITGGTIRAKNGEVVELPGGHAR